MLRELPMLADDLHAVAVRHGSGRNPQAGDAIVPRGQLRGTRLDALLDHAGSADVAAWVAWALDQPAGWWPADFERALLAFVADHFPTALDRRRTA